METLTLSRMTVEVRSSPESAVQCCKDGELIVDQYEFLGVDDVLINKLLSYGYKHVSIKPPKKKIHGYIKGCHVTLVFRLKYTILVQ